MAFALSGLEEVYTLERKWVLLIVRISGTQRQGEKIAVIKTNSSYGAPEQRLTAWYQIRSKTEFPAQGRALIRILGS